MPVPGDRRRRLTAAALFAGVGLVIGATGVACTSHDPYRLPVFDLPAFPLAVDCDRHIDDLVEDRPAGAGPPDQPAAPDVDLGTGNDPYTGTGARQVPGPYMTLAPPPPEPTSVTVARPQDPDEHVAARNLDGEVTGPVPAPKAISLRPPLEGALPPIAGEEEDDPLRAQAAVTPTPEPVTYPCLRLEPR
jgi:hypothetical protein